MRKEEDAEYLGALESSVIFGSEGPVYL